MLAGFCGKTGAANCAASIAGVTVRRGFCVFAGRRNETIRNLVFRLCIFLLQFKMIARAGKFKAEND